MTVCPFISSNDVSYETCDKDEVLHIMVGMNLVRCNHYWWYSKSVTSRELELRGTTT